MSPVFKLIEPVNRSLCGRTITIKGTGVAANNVPGLVGEIKVVIASTNQHNPAQAGGKSA